MNVDPRNSSSQLPVNAEGVYSGQDGRLFVLDADGNRVYSDPRIDRATPSAQK
jgi:hypothetical protein